MSNENQLIQTPEEETFDTQGLILNYISNWKWFAISVVLCLVAAYFFCASRIPTYNVSASVYLSDELNNQQNAFTLGNTNNPLFSGMDFQDETELEVFRSRNNIVGVVDSLDLAYSYYATGTLRDIPLYQNNAIEAHMDEGALSNLNSPIEISVEPITDNTYNVNVETTFNAVKETKEFNDATMPLDIELSHGKVTLSRTPVEKFEETQKIVISNPHSVANNIATNLTIEFAKNTKNVMHISIVTDVVQKGDDIIDALLALYNRNIIEDKNRSAVQTEAFILDRLVMIAGELSDVEGRLEQYRQQHNVTDIAMQSTLNLSLQSDYEKELAEIETEMNIFDEIERIVSSSDTYETLPAAVNDPTISTIIESYNRKVSNLNRTLEGSTLDNPLVVSLRQELSRDKMRILQNLGTAKRNLNTRRSSISRLESQSVGQLASAPSVDKGLQEIFREQQVKVNIYTFLLQRREEIALQKTLATNTARFIDNPAGSPAPVSPRKSMIFAAAFILGLAIPGLIIFVKRTLFPVFANKEELERVTKVPIIGEICSDPRQGKDNEKTDFVISENNSSAIAELFRLLRNNISFTRDGKKNKVLLVTSSISGEGKTFVASNLAMTYALMGKKTIVLGLDLRRPMLSKRMGFNNRKGITTYLSGQTDNIQGIIQRTHENENLYIIPAGPVPPNPNELLMSQRMENLMEQLRSEYDYIIVDSAPIGVISDTFLLTRYSDIQLYVTRASYTSKHNLKLINQAISNGQFNNAYIVINGVDMNSSAYVYSRYGYYGKYGRKSSSVYGYGYAKKSTEETDSDSKK